MNYETLNDEIKKAIKSRDFLRRDILRQVLNEVRNIEVNERREIAEADVDAMLKRVSKQIKETHEASIKAANNQERTDNLFAQINILDEYMPKIVDGVKLERMILDILAETENPNMGLVMKALGAKTGGNFNKKFASQYIKAAL